MILTVDELRQIVNAASTYKNDGEHMEIGFDAEKLYERVKPFIKMVPRDFDVCFCGDYRHQHENGTGACVFNRYGRFDVCHGFELCEGFRLAEKAEAVPI